MQRIGIIGAGGIALKFHLPELSELNDRCRVELVSGRRPHRLTHLCEQYDLPRSTHDYDEVIGDERIDAVVIATPHPLHVSWGIKALAAGKHVMMQKPLCESLDQAHAFVEAVERSDRTVMCLPHFNDGLYAAREAIAAGRIGRISGAHARTSHGGPEVYYREVAARFGEEEPDDLWFFDAEQASVGALFDMGVYAVAQIVAALGTIRRVAGICTTLDKPTQLEDTATLLLESAGGAIATVETGWCDPARSSVFSVHGTGGKVTLPGVDGHPATLHTPERLDSDRAPIRSAGLSPAANAGSAHQHWLDCIDSGTQPPASNAWAARHVVEVMLAGMQASREARTIDLHTTAEPPPVR